MFLNCCLPRSLNETFRGRVALVTGASAGLGIEFARQLAPLVRTLILVARRSDRLEALRGELARPGLEIQCHAIDLADRPSLEGLLTTLQSVAPVVDVIVNNAGLGDHGFFETSDWKRVESMLEVNVRALTRITHALLPGLVTAGSGAILNVSSVAGLVPVPQMGVYAATKSYVTSFTEALRAELRGTGVSVTALCPGPTETEFFKVAGRAGEEDPMHSPAFIKVHATQVVREGLLAVAGDRARVLPGWIIWGAFTLLSLVPIFFVRLMISQRWKRPERLRRRHF